MYSKFAGGVCLTNLHDYSRGSLFQPAGTKCAEELMIRFDVKVRRYC